MEADTPRPRIEVDGEVGDHWMKQRRKETLVHALKRMLNTSSVVYKYRKRQQELSEDSDPDPYDSSYIFYCFHNDIST